MVSSIELYQVGKRASSYSLFENFKRQWPLTAFRCSCCRFDDMIIRLEQLVFSLNYDRIEWLWWW